MSVLTTFLIMLVVLGLLAVPIWLLHSLSATDSINTNPTAIILVVAFTLLFAAAISFFTKAKRHETLAAAAG